MLSLKKFFSREVYGTPALGFQINDTNNDYYEGQGRSPSTMKTIDTATKILGYFPLTAPFIAVGRAVVVVVDACTSKKGEELIKNKLGHVARAIVEFLGFGITLFVVDVGVTLYREYHLKQERKQRLLDAQF